ncbi:MAG: efflux RND transporter periplasmic adaptor subunit [bacterium]|nr:efflux RND transporter periplasmic adaptor subunit [bacterium]
MTYKNNLVTFLPILTVTIFLFGCSKQTIQNPPPPKVVVSPVISKKVHKYREMVGEIIAKERVDLRARISGFIEKQNFPNGSSVKKGDVIFIIQKNQYKAQLEAGEAALMKAKAELTNAEIDFNRQKYLVNKSAVAVIDFDLAATTKATAQSEVLTAKANLELAKLDYSYTEVKAPYDGVIGIANYDPGNLVNLNSQPLITLVMMDPALVEFNVSESSLIDVLQAENKLSNKTKKGEYNTSLPHIIVKLILSNGTKYKYNGKITFVNNEINSMTGTIRLRATFDNPQQLLVPGGYVNVQVMRENKISAMLIPQASVQESQAGSYVLTVNDKNIVEEKYIETGTVYGTDIIVTKGLNVGEHVICQGLQKVRSGIKVAPVKAQNEPTEKITEKPDKSQTASKKNQPNSNAEKKDSNANVKPNQQISNTSAKKKDNTVLNAKKEINQNNMNQPDQSKEQTK